MNNLLRKISQKRKKYFLKIAMVTIFTALGIVLSYFNPFAYVPIFGIRPNPFAHIINAIIGVLMGPFYAVLTALVNASIRFSLGIGSHYAFPGGISGAIVVGLIAELISKKNDKFSFSIL